MYSGIRHVLPILIRLQFLLSGSSSYENGSNRPSLFHRWASLGLMVYMIAKAGSMGKWCFHNVGPRSILSRRDVNWCRRRVTQRFFGRGGCSFLLLFLLPLVIIVLSSLSSTSSSPLHHLHFFPHGNPFVKRRETDARSLRPKVRRLTLTPKGLMPSSFESQGSLIRNPHVY